MIYHDSLINDSELAQIIKKKELKWATLKEQYKETSSSWEMQDIGEVLHSIQEYVFLDFPKNKEITNEQLRLALDNMTRVAINLFECGNSEVTREYLTGKLFLVLKYLEPER